MRADPERVRVVFGDERETTAQSVLAAKHWRGMTDEERKVSLTRISLLFHHFSFLPFFFRLSFALFLSRLSLSYRPASRFGYQIRSDIGGLFS